MPLKAPVQNREYVLQQAKERFNPVLQTAFDQPAFILAEGDRGLVPGAEVVVVLFLSRFIDMFGDLIEKEDYRMASYKQRNRDKDFRVDESVFERWKMAGCLSD